MNRYADLESHRDLGEGAEEFEQTRRFTRLTEKTPDTAGLGGRGVEGESTTQPQEK